MGSLCTIFDVMEVACSATNQKLNRKLDVGESVDFLTNWKNLIMSQGNRSMPLQKMGTGIVRKAAVVGGYVEMRLEICALASV
jgi:hypothetical protein